MPGYLFSRCCLPAQSWWTRAWPYCPAACLVRWGSNLKVCFYSGSKGWLTWFARLLLFIDFITVLAFHPQSSHLQWRCTAACWEGASWTPPGTHWSCWPPWLTDSALGSRCYCFWNRQSCQCWFFSSWLLGSFKKEFDTCHLCFMGCLPGSISLIASADRPRRIQSWSSTHSLFGRTTFNGARRSL